MPTKALSHSQRDNRRTGGYRGSARDRGYTTEWDKTRAAFIRHNPACSFCPRPAGQVDHIKPLSEGGEALEWNNLRSVCVACHKLITSNYVRTGRNEMPPRAPDGFPLAAQITIVAGPPGSGKTTYVRERAKPGDLIFDADAIIAAISGLPLYDKPPCLLPFMFDIREAIFRRVGASGGLSAWIIGGFPSAAERSSLKSKVRASAVVVLEVKPDECLARITADPTRANARGVDWQRIIEDWWKDYAK